MKNIHIIATDKPSRIKQQYMNMASYALSRQPLTWRFAQHIYITSDEQPNHNDYYTIDGKKIYYCNTLNPTRNNHYKKIILTTDQDLINDGVQPIDDEFLEWFINNPTCEEVKVENSSVVKEHIFDGSNDGEIIWEYKIIIPKEEPKQETLEEGFNRIHNSMDFSEFDFASFKLGAKWQQERMYSEEEAGELVYNIIGEYGKNYGIMIDGAKLNELFEQFKKK